MKSIRFISVLLLFSFTFLLLRSCTTTITRPKNPEFNTEISILQQDLNNLVTCENFNFRGTETNTNGKINSELEISIKNGKNIPEVDSLLKALGKSIASHVKQALKDQNAYDEYTVLFVKQETSGVVNKSFSKGHIFKSVEL